MDKIIFRNENGFVRETIGGDFEVYKTSTRMLDGFPDRSTHYHATYGKNYCRDWLGRTYPVRHGYNPRETAIDCLR